MLSAFCFCPGIPARVWRGKKQSEPWAWWADPQLGILILFITSFLSAQLWAPPADSPRPLRGAQSFSVRTSVSLRFARETLQRRVVRGWPIGVASGLVHLR